MSSKFKKAKLDSVLQQSSRSLAQLRVAGRGLYRGSKTELRVQVTAKGFPLKSNTLFVGSYAMDPTEGLLLCATQSPHISKFFVGCLKYAVAQPQTPFE